ncbi:glycosyl hydrolase [Paraglaciecola sp.]|uniref:glycosyl hydrolase n=1 Tax=Paraglaciecola sp. TaxID=1920173 RepID=UPI003EF3EB66
MKRHYALTFIAALILSSSACSPNKETGLTSDLKKLDDQKNYDYQNLVTDFKQPPHTSKPLTWLHAMSGNMSAAGITKDLEAIADVGIGGTLLFNVTQGVPIGNIKFNSPEHIELIGHLAAESKRLGLSFGMHNCDGWTSSGGPWVTPEHSMKRLTFNQKVIQGGLVNIQLTQPPTSLDYYQDVATIAYPALTTEIDDATRQPVITASDPSFKPKVVSNLNLDDHTRLNTYNKQSAWLQFAYEKPYTLRLVDMLLHEGRGLEVSLHTSDDGKTFTKVHDLKLRRPGKTTYAFDEAFAGYTAKYFRLVSNSSMDIKEVKLSSTPTINNYLGRTSASRSDYQALKTIGHAPKHLVIQSKNILNLTSKVNADGVLTAQLPEGQWTIMRFGYTSTGAVNIPASREGTGLEVDKFSREAFKLHYDQYVTNVINKVKEVAPNTLHTLEIDSYEVGAQNWTHDYDTLFKQEFDYDLVPYLPLFAGKFVDSAKVAEEVLWDTRDLNNQLITQNYYGYFTELAHKDGIQTYLEPYGTGPFNELDVAKQADLPMGEFWLKRGNFRISASSSAANIYNKPLVSAEAFTQFPENNWLFHPAVSIDDNDKSWALGVNQHVFHRFAHQSNTHVMPGMTMNRWGTHVDRTQPWWFGAGKAWFEYIARGQHLLRQGHAVGDVLWYLGDATPTICPEKDALLSVLPPQINYDCLNSDVLQKLTVKDKKIVLPHGSQYKVLVLTNHHTLSFKSLQKIHQLSQQGVVIIGEPVSRLAGRYIDPEQQKQFQQMVDQIWSLPSTYNVKIELDTSHGHSGENVGKTHINQQLIDWSKIYMENNWLFDMSIADTDAFYFTHRQSDDLDIYFVYNNASEPRILDAQFNVTGKTPELWDAKTGEIKRLGAFSSDGNTTRVPISLNQHESAFVVFSQNSKDVEPIAPDLAMTKRVEVVLNAQTNQTEIQTPIEQQNVEGPWQVEFSDFYGLNNSYSFEKLVDWKDHSEQAIQDYSGTAVYRNTMVVPVTHLKDDLRLSLDLGQVSVAASVKINGKFIGTTWINPHQLDITDYVVAGENQLEIEVANLWVNRLLADNKLPDNSGFKIARWQDPITPMPKWFINNQPPPASERITFATQKFMKGNEPRESSGLVGPVKVVVKQVQHF